jgi:hypothetical protein
VSANQISNQDDTGLTDGDRTYVLSDGSVSLLYYGSDLTLHQNIYEPGGLTLKSTRQFFTGQMLPLSFLADGTNVDVAVVESTGDAGALGIFTGVVPESQIGTFDPTTLKPLSGFAISGPNACVTAYPGYLLALIPTTSGMDLYVIDVATASVAYSLTGASNILHGDTEIVACGLGNAANIGNTLNFNLIWTENAGGGTQNLEYAPLQCTQ